MGRFYVCPIIGTGAAADAFRPAIADKPGVQRVTACIDSIPRGEAGAGRPRLPWAVVWVEMLDWRAADEDPSLVNLGDIAVDSQVLSKPVPKDVKTALRRADVMTAQEANSPANLRGLLRTLVQKHYPYADEMKAFPGVK